MARKPYQYLGHGMIAPTEVHGPDDVDTLARAGTPARRKGEPDHSPAQPAQPEDADTTAAKEAMNAATLAALQGGRVHNEMGHQMVDWAVRGRDALDFANVSRGQLREMLEQAYCAGRHARW